MPFKLLLLIGFWSWWPWHHKVVPSVPDKSGDCLYTVIIPAMGINDCSDDPTLYKILAYPNPEMSQI